MKMLLIEEQELNQLLQHNNETLLQQIKSLIAPQVDRRLTKKQAEKIFEVSGRTLMNRKAAGTINYKQDGRIVTFSESELSGLYSRRKKISN